MNEPRRQTPAPAGDVTAQLARLLPELAVVLYESAPHHNGELRPAAAEPLTGRQMEAVVFLSHRHRVTMGEFADGLEISRAAASELVARLSEKDVVRRETDPDDRRVVHVRLAGEAERYADVDARRVAPAPRRRLRPLSRTSTPTPWSPSSAPSSTS